ncbi:MAG TPA: hypothetical protein VFP97_08805 [Chitinophagaceae bacterium]|nr:hypothetical protein [Chitinophagaceae bacterium]
MKKNFSMLTLILVLAITGCQKNIQQPAEQKDSELAGAAANKGGPANGSVYLIVTVDDAAGNMIRSDNGTAYIHGTDRVEAQLLSSDGNFYMNTNNNTVKQPIRSMQFLPGSDVDLSGNRNYSLRTSAPQDPAINNGNTVWIQNLAVGQSQLMSMRAWGVEQQGVVDWKLLFRNGPENNSSSLTDYVLVTRTSSNPDTWTIEPATPAAVARLVNGTDVPFGSEYYQVPFRLTLRRK